MATPGPGQEMHKVSLEHCIIPESKETNKDSYTHKPAGKEGACPSVRITSAMD